MTNPVEIVTPLHPAGRLVLEDGRWRGLAERLAASAPVAPCRLAYAAAHVVMQDGYRDVGHSVAQPGPADEVAAHVDWPRTMELRRELDELGFAVAEAMDTAQRFRLGWAGARHLIEACGALGLHNGFVAGAGTDHLAAVPDRTALIDGVVQQAAVIRAAGGEVILLPMPQLTAWGCGPADYVEVYRAIIGQVEGPVYVHWLGEMFLPELAGYFPADSFLQVMALDPGKVRGAKLSLLDAAREVELRAALRAQDQLMLTGDDFHFASLIAGAGAPTGSTRVGDRTVPVGDFSHALLGILDGIAQPAALALQCLAQGDRATYQQVMDPCEELARCIFETPTTYYKSGLAFLAWLNGQQGNAMLINHEERMRDVGYYLRVAELASRAGVIRDTGLAADRLHRLLKEYS